MCRDISPISEMRIETQMRSGHLLSAKSRLASGLIDAQAIYNDYWGSTKHEFTVPSESSSPVSSLVSDHEAQRTSLSLEGITSIIGL